MVKANYGIKIWRDDDPSIITNVGKLIFVHEIFQRFDTLHTLALIMKDIEKNQELVNYILAHKSEFDLQLHCWEHFDHSEDHAGAKESIKKGKAAIKDIFGVIPTIWFPPWNACTPELATFCLNNGLTARPDKISLDQYIRKEGQVKEDVINFHYWYEPEVNDLYKALKIYNK